MPLRLWRASVPLPRRKALPPVALPAPMPRRAGYQRLQLVVSAAARRQLHAALDALVPGLHASPEARKVRWSLDVDPVDLY